MRRHPLKMAGMAIAVTMLLGFSDLRRDEVECESAIAHMRDCCPADFEVVQGACNYGDGCGTTYLPTLSEDQSLCIQGLSCSAIRDRGLCQEVAELVPPSQSVIGANEPLPEHEQVCD